jgi:hypothetical protein
MQSNRNQLIIALDKTVGVWMQAGTEGTTITLFVWCKALYAYGAN